MNNNWLTSNTFHYSEFKALNRLVGEKERKNIWTFLILGMIGAFSLAIMDYSTLSDYLSISYSIGVCVGACTFIYVKHDNNAKLLAIFLFLIGTGIALVWCVSLWDMKISLIIGTIYVFIFIFIIFVSFFFIFFNVSFVDIIGKV